MAGPDDAAASAPAPAARPRTEPPRGPAFTVGQRVRRAADEGVVVSITAAGTAADVAYSYCVEMGELQSARGGRPVARPLPRTPAA